MKISGMFSTDSSGDFIADRRFLMAAQLFERGDHEAALDLLLQTRVLAPEWPPLPFRRGEMLMTLGRLEEARAEFTACLHLDPEDRLGAAVKLALLGAMPQPETLPAPYVTALFDDYAPRFESALIETLSYRVPQLLAESIEKYRPRDEKTAEIVLDLGCGTGLAAEAVIRRAAWVEGVDLSSGMLDMARAKGFYNRLEQGDILAALHDNKEGQDCRLYDLVLAADVLVYIGELAPLFAAIADRMRGGALFAFSTQALDDKNSRPYALGPDHRYAHSAVYLQQCLEQSGLRPCSSAEHVIRQDGGENLRGYIVLAEKPAMAAGLPPSAQAPEKTNVIPFPLNLPGSKV